MRLLIVRHAEAMPAVSGVSDRERALTAEGERRLRAAARGLAHLVPAPDVLLASPLLRARQTAALLAAAWGEIVVTPENALASGSVEVILDALSLHAHAATVALVGHEPTVSGLLAELIGGSSSDPVSFSPGAAAFVDVVSLARRDGRLLWFLPPDVAATSAP
jgi:phosphohistidine phosphatase